MIAVHVLHLPLATLTKCCQLFPRGLLLLLAWNMLMSSSNKYTLCVPFELLYTNLSIEPKGWLIPVNILCVCYYQ